MYFWKVLVHWEKKIHVLDHVLVYKLQHVQGEISIAHDHYSHSCSIILQGTADPGFFVPIKSRLASYEC